MVMHGEAGDESYEELGLRILKDIKGKTVESLVFMDESNGVQMGESFLIISFSDNTSIKIRYDWIYDIKIIKE